MASRAVTDLFDAGAIAESWIADYCAHANGNDVLRARKPGTEGWGIAFEELAAVSGGSLSDIHERAQRHADDIGTGFRIAGEGDERPWPLSPIPLMIPESQWRTLAEGVAQRARLMETVIADLYGPGKLVAAGRLPATVVTGSPYYLRPMAGMSPPGGRHLHFVAVDIGRGPDGEWRVLADHLRAPAGAGYALENRLAMARLVGGLQTRLNIQRHAPFFAAFREGLASVCRRSDPRIALLTPGRFNPSYPEQAHLARYLGFLLVEGADLAVADDRLYVRTIAGMKRIDAVWRRIDPRLLDPLAFDSHSTIGVPGLIDAMAADEVVVANAPGSGVMEAPAFAAFVPGLCEAMLGEKLKLPNIATWWCGQEPERDHVLAHLDELVIAPAFGVTPRALPGGKPVLGASLSSAARKQLIEDLRRRPQDYVGQEIVHLSTMPVVADDRLAPRPFVVRVFAARAADGEWTVLPGGFARIGEHPDPRATVMGEGSWSADVCIHGRAPVAPVTLLNNDAVTLRRNPGTLPSRVADNLFWLGRYLERGEALLGIVRVLLGHSISADAGAAVSDASLSRLVALADEAAPPPKSHDRADVMLFARAAMEGVEEGFYSVRSINRQSRLIGQISRERLSADMIRLLDAPFPTKGNAPDRAGALQRRFAALAGLAAEHMVRTDAWRFHDLGRRVERALHGVRILRAFGGAEMSDDDLSVLLDLADNQISYRQRYMAGIARLPVLDLVALDPANPRGLAFQLAAATDHLDRLPVLSDDGFAEEQQEQAHKLLSIVTTTRAEEITRDLLADIEARIMKLSDAIARRYFLHGATPMRAPGLTLA